MPNWCEGNIRFRGKAENIRRFLMNEIVCCRMVNHETVEEKPIIEDKDFLLIFKLPNEHSWFYIKGTRRNFFETDVIEVWIDRFGEADKDKEVIVCVDNFRVAWSFEHDDAWKEFAKRYDFDVKMTGWESGMLFEQVKTIHRNGSVTDSVTEYRSTEEWMWNCPMPNLGG